MQNCEKKTTCKVMKESHKFSVKNWQKKKKTCEKMSQTKEISEEKQQTSEKNSETSQNMWQKFSK